MAQAGSPEQPQGEPEQPQGVKVATKRGNRSRVKKGSRGRVKTNVRVGRRPGFPMVAGVFMMAAGCAVSEVLVALALRRWRCRSV
eukprot:scaffold54018_cov67-Attheya_sp.AAC.1